MTLGGKQGSRQTNLPWLSSAGQQSDIEVDREGKIVDRRPKIKTGVGKSKMQRGKFKQISLSSVPPDVYVQRIINPARGRKGTGWVWTEGVACT